MKLIKNLALSLILLTVYLLISDRSFAAGTSPACQPIYGGGQTCVQTGAIILNKMVQNPKTGAFVDNLGINDPKFAQDQTITFSLAITNTGNAVISSIDVTDTLPQFVTFVSGPGNFNQTTSTLSFTASDLKAGESRNFQISGKVVPFDKLPSDKKIICVVNLAGASSSGLLSQDNSQLCIEKSAPPAPDTATKGGLKVFPPAPITQAPSTGPEMIPLLSLIPAGITGFLLRKRSKISKKTSV